MVTDVVDASVAVEYLLRTSTGQSVASVVAANLFGVPLLAADGPLSRAPSLGTAVHNVRAA